MSEQLPSKILNELDDEYLRIINPIITNEEFIRRKTFNHHEHRSVYGHSLMVSVKSYHLAKKLKLDYKAAAIGGLLHDFYYNDWQLNKSKMPLRKQHGFVHAREALENSKKLFPELIDKKVANIIKRHMFPLNFIPPFYYESWLICFVDKYCSLEVFKSPQEWYKYVGLKNKKN